MKSLLPVFILFSMLSCAQTPDKSAKIQVADKHAPVANEAVATFSEGCFWHAEIVFQSLVGVRDAVSGYAGGTTTKPTYEDVATGTTGHAETVQSYYDLAKISFKTLVTALVASMDPTEMNRQGNDAGTEYRSIAFYRTEEEKQIIEAEIKRINDSKKYHSKVVTEVLPFKNFYKAEPIHQEYIANHPENGYVQNVSIPEFLKFKREFKGNFKP